MASLRWRLLLAAAATILLALVVAWAWRSLGRWWMPPVYYTHLTQPTILLV